MSSGNSFWELPPDRDDSPAATGCGAAGSRDAGVMENPSDASCTVSSPEVATLAGGATVPGVAMAGSRAPPDRRRTRVVEQVSLARWSPRSTVNRSGGSRSHIGRHVCKDAVLMVGLSGGGRAGCSARSFRPAPPRALSGRDHPRRASVMPHPQQAPVLVKTARRLRAATAVAFDEASRRNGPGGAARMERGRYRRPGIDWPATSVDGRAGAGRAVEAAGAVSQRHNPACGGARSAGPASSSTWRKPSWWSARRGRGGYAGMLVGRYTAPAGADAGHRGTRVADLGLATTSTEHDEHDAVLTS